MTMTDLNLPDLEAQVRALLRQVPAGRCTTCKALAAALGDPVAARWIGYYILHHEPDATVPWQRVVRATGELGEFAGGRDEKRQLLSEEGVFCADDRVETASLFETFISDQPLLALRARQQEWLTHWREAPLASPPQRVGGIDLAYPEPGVAQVSYVLYDLATDSVCWRQVLRQPVQFPYITTYLSFRELPAEVTLLRQAMAAGQRPDVLLVDGSGRLHPHGAGIATCLGIVLDLPTIGVTKRPLVGRVDPLLLQPEQPHTIEWQGTPTGAAILPRGRSRQPLYVSPGQRITLWESLHLVGRLLRDHPLPEPLYWADRWSRSEPDELHPE